MIRSSAAVSTLLLLSGCCMGGQDIQAAAFSFGFAATCVPDCQAEGGGDTCQPYCDCMLQRIEADHQQEHMASLDSMSDDAIMADPWFQGAFAACGSGFHDRMFRTGCTAECTSDCGAYCDCLLQQLRAGMTPEQGTQWMITNLEQAVTTAEGDARTMTAATACASLAPPELQ